VPKYIRSPKSSGKIEWQEAPDVKKRISYLAAKLDIAWMKKSRIFCFRSINANSRAYARIWGFSRIWQMALKEEPAYIIEVLSEKYDHLPEKEKDKVLVHEMTHIPRNFSGSLVPHTRRLKGSFHDKLHKFLTQLDNL
jgi:predicted metallopeptidase